MHVAGPVPSSTQDAAFLRTSGDVVSKGMDRKKEQKKKPAKTPKEKRAAKDEKKSSKPFAPG